jgi:hypothetical protein
MTKNETYILSLLLKKVWIKIRATQPAQGSRQDAAEILSEM